MRPTPLPYAHQTIEPDDLAAVGEALTTDWITQGPIVARFEGRLLMTLPLFPGMTDGDQNDVLRALDKVFAHYAR